MGDSSTLPHGQAPPHHSDSSIETAFLIVGAGPAGSALASFLASYGLTGIIVASASGTAREPRAHITNPAALECLRDIGLEEEVLTNATHGDNMIHTFWAYSMTGPEYGRINSWGHKPDRKGDYAAASPCKHVDLPQTLLEPILVKNAIHKGWKMRFDSQFIRYDRDSEDGPITSTIKDNVTGATYTIRSKYLFGCDGGRSQVMRQLAIPLIKEPGQGLAINFHIKADLSEHIQHRLGNLHWLTQPDIEHPPWGWACIGRMVKPWHEWMFIVLCEPGFSDYAIDFNTTPYRERISQFIGDPTIPFEVIDISKWFINEIVASSYSSGNIFCLGDAVHRHPPINGLGSNTCIQDAYNLAWKIAHVESHLAAPSLLHTYTLERQPIGAGIVARANQGFRDHNTIWSALGALEPDPAKRKEAYALLSSPTPAGRAKRQQLRAGIDWCEHEYGGIGIEMNQTYQSPAVVTDDEEEGQREALPDDVVLQYGISTYPGSRLPHCWVNKRVPDVAAVSTQDLAGKGAFCLFTGVGGEGWKEGVREVRARWEGLKINAYGIGWCQDYQDVYGDWQKRRGVEEDGCVLVRPDRTVCWRSKGMVERPGEKLVEVIGKVLGRA